MRLYGRYIVLQKTSSVSVSVLMSIIL